MALTREENDLLTRVEGDAKLVLVVHHGELGERHAGALQERAGAEVAGVRRRCRRLRELERIVLRWEDEGTVELDPRLNALSEVTVLVPTGADPAP